jgi:cytochrome bd-type quinol oxidase subunit 2
MRLASTLFALLSLVVLVSNIGSWLFFGAPVRVTTMMGVTVTISAVLAILLWRRQRWAAIVGLVVAAAMFLLMAGAAYFLWPYILPSRGPPRALFDFAALMLTILLTAAIAAALTRGLLSNQLERP